MMKKSRLEFTNTDKVFWPSAGYTKGDLINYYQQVSQLMLPYLKDRPHSLLRQPDGLRGEAFFQKDVDHTPPGWVQTAAIFSESNKKDINYLVCNSTDALLYMVQLGCIEINPWNSTVKHLDKPDWLVIDLDPEDISFTEVVRVAQAARKILEDLDVTSYPKTSGKTGIHIYIPLAAKYEYDRVRQFAQLLAVLIYNQVPEITSLERSPKKRQKKIYVDFLQNREGQTLVAPYSVRPTETASVSAPLKWDEVNYKLKPGDITIKSILQRIDKVGDLWEPVLGKGVDIKKALKRLD